MRDSLIASALAAALFVLLLPFAIQGVDWVHDGAMLKAAMDVRSGQVLFRDTAMVYGAMTCYLQVLALLVFPSLLSIKLLTLAAYAVSLFFNYLAWRAILPRTLAVLGGGMFVLFIPTAGYGTFMPWSSVYAMMFQSLALYSLFQIIGGKEPARWGFVLGVVSACTFWCRQPVGLALVFALVVIGIALPATGWKITRRDRRQTIAGTAGGFLLVNVLMLAGIIFPGALSAWWYQNFTWPRKWASEGVGADAWHKYAWLALRPAEAAALLGLLGAAVLPRGFARLGPRRARFASAAYYPVLLAVIIWQRDRITGLFSPQTGGWILAIPAVILAQVAGSALAAFLARGRAQSLEFHLVAALGILSLASLLQYFPVTDPWHVMWSLAPVLGLFLHVLWRWTGWRASLCAVVLAAGLFPALRDYAAAIRTSRTQPAVVLATPPALRGLRVPPAQARVLAQISAAVDPVLQRDPDIPSMLFGGKALVLCYTGNRENPSPYCFEVAGLTPDGENQKRYRYIHDARPLLFLSNPMRAALKDYLQRVRYVSLGYVQELDIEILAPREVLESNPLTAGRPPPAGAPGAPP